MQSLPLLLLFLLLSSSSSAAAAAAAQSLSPSQSKSLLRLNRLLAYPSSLSPLVPGVDLCSLPASPSLSLSCSAGRLTSLSISSNRSSPLLRFSSDSLFTTLARFPALRSLSLTRLGLSGPLPDKVRRLANLSSLNLSSNSLSGPIPTLNHLALTTLSLSNNLFNGALPDLSSLTHLQDLDLSGNQLTGSFPAGVAAFSRIQSLNLSANKLAGAVPAFVFSLPAIEYLDISDNKFTGAVPGKVSCGDRLAFVDVSGNMLVGRLPECIRGNSSGRVVLSSGNCLSGGVEDQRVSSYCNAGALAAVLPPVGKKGEGSGSKSKVGLIAGIAGGVGGGAAVLGLLLFVVFKRGKTGNGGGFVLQKDGTGKAPVKSASRTPADARHMSQAVRIGTLGLTPYRVFTMEELDEATNNFDPSNSIAEGPRGQFYKGWLQDGSAVMVRCMKLKQKHSPQTLIQYMDIVSKLRHCHLVSILGHCIDNDPENANTTSTVFLVLEYVSNGTLRSHLTEWRKREMLKWRQRIAAVIGVARGIQFLHTVAVPGIVGNDLSIENILLDQTLTAKISNYNLPILPKNKNNKIDSESPFGLVEDTNLGSNRNLEHGEKEDVYQLGLILLEVITGESAQGELDKLKRQLQKSLNEEPSKLQEMTDPTIRGTFAHDSLRTAVELMLNCVAENPRERPSIDDILWNLQYSVQVQDGWASSENLSTQS